MYKTIPSSILSINHLRKIYFSSLDHFQELYLEQIIIESDVYTILEEETILGYCIVSKEDLIIEYWVDRQFNKESYKILNHIIKRLEIKGIYCKSFDNNLLNSCLNNRFDYIIVGCLYRDIKQGISFDNEMKLQTEFAEIQDIDVLINQECDFINSLEELKSMIYNKDIIIFRDKCCIVGLGFITEIVSGYNYYDIGVWVNPIYRKKGYGKYIISHLKKHCIKNDITPICGCDIDNLASQKIIESNGYIPIHKLLLFCPG